MNLENLVVMDQRLGEDSFGAVFMCNLGGKKVAAKKLYKSKEETDLLIREASILKRLQHGKHIAYTYGITMKDESLYMITEYGRFGDLKSFLNQHVGSVTYEQKIFFCRGILLGLLYCHSMDVFHGNIKCSNVILGEYLVPKLTDFGLSMTVDNIGCYKNLYDESLYWTAPELFSIRNETVYREFIADPYPCDVYSLGATFCEISYDGTTEFLDSEALEICVIMGIVSPTPKEAFLEEIVDECCQFGRNERISLKSCFDMLENVAETQLLVFAVDDKWQGMQQDIQANSKLELPPSFILCRPAENLVVGPSNLSLLEWMCIKNCKDAVEYLIRIRRPEAKQLEWLYGISKLCKSQDVVDFLRNLMGNAKHSDLSLADLVDVNPWQFIGSLIKSGALGCSYSPLAKAIEVQCNKLVQALVDENTRFDNWAIFDAIKSKNSEAVRILVNAGACVEYKNSHTGDNPLLVAIKAKNAEIVKILVEFKADVQKSGQRGPLYTAAVKGNREIVEILINAGATIDIESRLWEFLVQDLEQQGKIEILQFILDAMSNSDIKRKSTPLCGAIQNERPNFVQTLIGDGANVNKRNYDGYSPLHWAVIIGNVRIVRILLEAGADIDAKTPKEEKNFYATFSSNYFNRCTPLHIAIVKKNLGIAKLLIKSGADFSLKNETGQTIMKIADREDKKRIASMIQKFAPATSISLQRAKKSMSIGTVEILTNRLLTNINILSKCLCIATCYGNAESVVYLPGYKVDTNKKIEGKTPLEWVEPKGYAKTVQILIKACEGENLLEWAKSADLAEIVQTLIKAGANFSVNDKNVNSLLFICVIISLADMVLFLIKKGADVNSRNKGGYAPIHYAKSREIAEVLIAHGADINANPTNGRTPLFEYVDKSLIDMVQLLVDMGVNVNARNQHGYTPIHYVKSREIAEILIARGADINAKSINGLTPLFICITRSLVDMVQFLLEKGANVNTRNKGGYTPVHFAKNREIAEILIAHGADINAKDESGRTPLFGCVDDSLVDVVQFLIKKGADVNARDKDGYTPIHGVRDREIAEILIDHGADINVKNANGIILLFRCVKESKADMVQFLLEKGADVNTRSKGGYAPIHFVKSREIAEFLIAHGADINVKDESGRTPLFECVDDSLVDIVQFLIGKGADVNTRDKGGSAPIHAVRNKEIAEILIDHGANINVKNANGITLLIQYVKESKADMVQFLLEKGADVNAGDKNGIAPIHFVKNREIAEILIKAGADVNARSINGRTLLFECVENSLVEVVQFLIEMGADVNTRDKDGHATIHHVKNKEVTKFLTEAGANVKKWKDFVVRMSTKRRF